MMTSQWVRLRPKSPTSRLFTQPFVQAHIKENIKAPHRWPVWGVPPVTGGFPTQRTSNVENVSIWWRHHVPEMDHTKSKNGYWKASITAKCVSILTIIGSDNGLSSGRRLAIIWTNARILLIGTLGTNFSEILIEIYILSFKKMHFKLSSDNWRPFCLGHNVLTEQTLTFHSRDHKSGNMNSQ